MYTIKSENPVPIDVDDTLVVWPENPYVEPTEGCYLKFNHYGRDVYLKPHEKNIQLLKSYKARGYHVTVWSANGFDWAQQVVTQLLLRPFVDVCMTKPSKYVDDLDSGEWMQRVFINEVGINE